MSKNVFDTTAKNIPIWLLDAVIIIGIAAMAVLIPILSRAGEEKSTVEDIHAISTEYSDR